MPVSDHPTAPDAAQPAADVASEPGAHAAIDIGTNSIHLLVARSDVPGRMEVLAQEKEVVRLGEGADDMKRLTDDAMDRGIETLERFRQVAEIWDADIVAVATSAVREADNHDVFLTRARDEAGIDVEVISGVEEARLIRVGVVHALPVFDNRCLAIDIGGGSTELIIGERDHIVDARSLKLGAIRLTNRFFTEEPLTKGAVKECRRFVRSFVQPTAHEFTEHGFDIAVGSSGTIETLATMALARRGDDPGRALNNLGFTAAELAGVVDDLVGAGTAKERSKLPGMDAKRADIIVAGALILEQIVAALAIEEVRVSEFALREGVLLDALARRDGDSLHHLTDLRRASIVHLADAFDPDREHSEHLTALALDLYDATVDVHGLPESTRELLEAAGLLHNVGLFISHAAHHKHSYYVIRNSEHLQGFNDHEIELIAQISRYHRKSAPKDKHPEYATLRSEDRRMVSVLAGILRIAIGLDRSHSLSVERIEVDVEGEHLTIRAVPALAADLSLEIYSADQRKDLLADSIGLDVDIIEADQN